jgi:transcriptional regulator with XRE-family HTH domain
MVDDEACRRTLQLAENIRALRKAAGLSGKELGSRAEMSQSKISKIESARVIPSESDVSALATALRLDAVVAADLRRQVRGLRRSWKLHRDLLVEERSRQQLRWSQVEKLAQSLDVFSINAFPALLQTPSYAEAMLRVARIWWSEDELDKHLVLRLERQAQLYDLSRTFRFVMTESALRTVFGSRGILDAQLQTLSDLAKRPNVHVAVLEEEHPQVVTLASAFAIFDGEQAIVELPTADVTFREPEDVSAYCNLFESIWTQATDCTDDFIERYYHVIDVAGREKRSVTALNLKNKFAVTAT